VPDSAFVASELARAGLRSDPKKLAPASQSQREQAPSPQMIIRT
jgi:hypothetical protein